ncbi:MAG: hypothetical protein HC836_46245 [Richelia sp. RM2_1_2]|nr:hypothetical protein [Richelia sp. RM2_1_2]
MIDLSESNFANNSKMPLTCEQKKIVQEYYFLATLKSLSEEQSQRMAVILEFAIEDNVIDFLLQK